MKKTEWDKYNELFDDESKIAAFDLIAKNYYCANFATMQKSDFETLLFSIYIERILEKTEYDYASYSDYTLSRLLGISQTRVANFKLKKELKYPFEKFSWKNSFERAIQNVSFDNERIIVPIQDINLYYELKNAVEMIGGYLEVSLSKSYIKLTPYYFVKLLDVIDCNNINFVNIIKDKLSKQQKVCDKINEKDLGDNFIEILESVISDIKPGVSGPVFNIIKLLIEKWRTR